MCLTADFGEVATTRTEYKEIDFCIMSSALYHKRSGKEMLYMETDLSKRSVR